MKALISSFLFVGIFLFSFADEVHIPPNVERDILAVLKKFEGKLDKKKTHNEILQFNHEHVEAVIFKHLDEIEINSHKALSPILKVLGTFNTHRSILTIAKYAEPFVRKGQKVSSDPRSRHIRVSAITALMMNPTEERASHLIKHLNDKDTIFQSIILRSLRENKITKAIEPSYEVFKNSNSEDSFNVKIDSGTLILKLSDDPVIKNNILVAMLSSPNLHIRKAGLTLVPDGGLAGDQEVQEELVKLLKTTNIEELELACNAAGKIQTKLAIPELLRIQKDEKSSMVQWEALFALYKIKHPASEIIALVKEKINLAKNNKTLKSADEHRFERLLEFISKSEGLKQ